MRALITGSQGFVGGYLRQELEENDYEVIGLDVQPGENTVQVNLLDASSVERTIEELKPDAIFHLAGQADVAKSWSIPQKTIEMNTIAAVSLMEAVRHHVPQAKLVMVGSSDQYGNLGKAGESVSETTEMNPQSPYAISKLAQEKMAQVYVRAYGLQICMTRSFNHAGVGQRLGFMIPDFASGVVKVEKGLAKSIKVGNLDSRRDFTHVKDVVRAYRFISEKGLPGEIYNVGSGVTHSAREILDHLRDRAVCYIPVEQDPTRMRPSDTPVICCDHAKLTAQTGWEAEIPLETILQDVLDEWRTKF